MKKNKKIKIIIILLLITSFIFITIFIRNKDKEYSYLGEWYFSHKSEYTMNLKLWKNKKNKIKGSYCSMSKGKFNCRFSETNEGQWDDKIINIKTDDNNNVFVIDNINENNEMYVDIKFLEKRKGEEGIEWSVGKVKKGENFDIPYKITLKPIVNQ